MGLIVNRDSLPILDQFSEEDFVDCVFKIERLESDGDYWQLPYERVLRGRARGRGCARS